MIEKRMKFHLVSDSTLQHCNPLIPQNNYKEWQIMLGLKFSVGDTIQQFTISMEQDN